MKLFKVIFIGLLLIQTGYAQKTELRIGTGYHFSSASQYFIDNIDNSSNNVSYKRVNASLGRGVAAFAGINYTIKPWLGISMDLQYNNTVPAVKGTNLSNGIDYSYSEENKWRSQTICISPSLVFKIQGQKLNPYTRFGFVLPVYSKIKVTANYQSSGLGGPMTSGDNIKIFRLKNTIGYTASAGIAPSINKRTSFFAEICLLSQSINVKKSTLTSDKVNGVEKIDTYPTISKETIYVKKIENPNYDPDKPNKQLGFSLPYSSIGLTVGFNIKL